MNRKKKQAIATLATAIMLVSGTYAWQAFDQIVQNESLGFDADQGLRLHNDFNGEDADVYVENYASLETGATAFTRVRLYEYMELGSGAGNLTDSVGTALNYESKTALGLTILRGDLQQNEKPDINDESTWDVYLHQGNNREEEDIHTYLNLNYGDIENTNKGAKVYMPTFNKNFGDHNADIKGTLNNQTDRTDGDRVASSPYVGYQEYTLGEKVSGTATYSRDALYVLENDGQTEFLEEHTAQSTLEGYVITMEEWLAIGEAEAAANAEKSEEELESETETTTAQKGNFWVIDTDGWAYWANGIAPQTATSLLVDSVTKIRQPDESYHYALHVEAQAATSDGWVEGVAAMNKGDIGEDALTLMEVCWSTDAAIYEITSISIDTPASTRVALGNELQLTATVNTPEEPDKAKSVLWSIAEEVTEVAEIDLEEESEATGDDTEDEEVETIPLTQAEINGTLSSTGLFKPIRGMEGKFYIITATAKYDVTKTDTIRIKAYDPEMTSALEEVTGKDYDEIVGMVGSTSTLTVNGTVFYVIGYNETSFTGGAAVKLLAKTSVGSSAFGSNNTYSTSTIRTYTLNWYNNTFLPAGDLTDSDVCYEGTTTRSTGSPTITTGDKAFILSYTEANALSSTIRTTGSNYWLRTPNVSYSYSSGVCNVTSSGDVYNYYSSSTATYSHNVSFSHTVRPALWIYL